ncbi:MAG TPA: ABC transporter permease subunit [Candidatus Tectomicrobia bacterium]|nr:ABC transporter permease subunit [Candidatus Tectomicrobia bacterium]
MANHVEGLRVGGPGTPTRRIDTTKARVRRRLLVDRLSRRLVTLGGVAIIASILAILVVIAAEVYPLFKKPVATAADAITAALDSAPLAVGVDEYREIAYVVTTTGVQFLSTEDGTPHVAAPLPGLNTATVVSTSTLGRGPLALGLSDGRVVPVEVNFTVSFPEGRRRVEPNLLVKDPIVADPSGSPIRQLAFASPDSGAITAVVVGTGDLALISVRERRALIGPSTKEESRQRLSLPIDGEITALVIDNRGEDIFAGTSSGQVIRVDLRKPAEPRIAGSIAATGGPGIAVSTMAFLIGDRTLIVGDASGRLSSWQLLRDDRGVQLLQKLYDFTPHDGAVVALSPSRRDKGFISADASGNTHLNYGTTGETLLTVKAAGERIRAVTFAPKADGFIVADAAGHLSPWALLNPHPEITLRSLFGKVWYEGYAEPEFVWQSTGGTDDFEAKFSLTPLIYGTLKGTFYAMLFAVPIALLSALYASQFMHPTLKGVVKPVVEIMAALPSVVLGFIAGLWLAPMVEKVVPGLILMPIVIPALILCALMLWRMMPVRSRTWLRPGAEVFFLVPVALLGGWLAISLGSLFEGAVFGGDYRAWLLRVLGLTYDQRNSLVVGFAMGFAVIPLIFTIAEDSLSNVPQHLRAGSLALGATPWQTAMRVILPTASPGIFSAIMIGFGRAVGETMIVLMATGNTPMMDWSIFNGFRALSANIAVELPEAPEGGTLYRILFLAAFLLFVMTFLVNTVAEMVRLRLRRKYRYL